MMSDQRQPSGEIQSYILRLWPEGDPGAQVWRVSLVHIPDGERIGFADLESAFTYLKEQTESGIYEEQSHREDSRLEG